MDNSVIIKESLEKYDMYKNKISLLKKYNVVIDQSGDDNIRDKINFYDKNNELVFSSEFEVIGCHIIKPNVWVWSWSHPYFKKKHISFIKKLLNYGFELDTFDEAELKARLITSRYFIIDHVQIDVILALTSYITKNPYIFPQAKYDDNNKKILTNYFIILNKEGIEKL